VVLLSATIPGSYAQTDNPYILNGTATKENCNCYTLTIEANNQSGSIWNKNKIDLGQSFDFKFNVYLGCKDSEGADGIAFVLQPISTSIGALGGGLGYDGVTPSVGVLIDTWHNTEDNDPSGDHIAIHRNGVIDHGPSYDITPPLSALADGGNIEDCKWHTLRITWDATSKFLRTEIDGVERVTATIDMVNDIFLNDPMVYWGFTAATGGSNNHQRICTSLNPYFRFPEGQTTCFPEPVQFIDSSTSFGTIEKWYWDFGDGTEYFEKDPPVHNFPAPGNYPVRLAILGNDGCVSDTFTRVVVAGSKPVADFSYMPFYVCSGYPVTFLDSSRVEYGTINRWSWKINQQGYSVQNPEPITLTTRHNRIELSVATQEGCVSDLFADSVVMGTMPCPEFYVPSAFSPNNDGRNDRFQFVAAGFSNIDLFNLYNRYGQLVYSSTDPRKGWDGRFKGMEQPSGTYVWMIRGTDLNGVSHFKKGTVTLVR
jgi:gliding motility-associated-like protein